MKISISLISTILLSILLFASLYYGFFVKPKEITYTSYIPTTYKETKTSYITERETLTKITTKTETSISTTTYKIIEDEALISVRKYAYHGESYNYTKGKEIIKYYTILEFIAVNTGEHSILFDKSLIIIKGKGLSEEKIFNIRLPYYSEKEKFILTQLNRTAVFEIEVLMDYSKIKEEDYHKEYEGELFITYKIIETNQFKTFTSTFNYTIYEPYKPSD
jgi:hypothetical protein